VGILRVKKLLHVAQAGCVGAMAMFFALFQDDARLANLRLQGCKAASPALCLQRMQALYLQAPQLLTLFFKEF